MDYEAELILATLTETTLQHGACMQQAPAPPIGTEPRTYPANAMHVDSPQVPGDTPNGTVLSALERVGGGSEPGSGGTAVGAHTARRSRFAEEAMVREVGEEVGQPSGLQDDAEWASRGGAGGRGGWGGGAGYEGGMGVLEELGNTAGEEFL
jgi:hypothetical protein